MGIYSFTRREVTSAYRRGAPDHPRLFALRHGDRVRPRPRERPAHAPIDLPAIANHIDLGDDWALADDHDHHAPPHQEPSTCSRRHAEGLRLRALVGISLGRDQRSSSRRRSPSSSRSASPSSPSARAPACARRSRTSTLRRRPSRNPSRLRRLPSPHQSRWTGLPEADEGVAASAAARREARRKRRRAKPHGRAR